MSLYIGDKKVAPIIKIENTTIQEIEIQPSTSEQTISPSGNIAGFAPVKVEAVTSSIDSNIQPENIKAGITILGVTGTYTGS